MTHVRTIPAKSLKESLSVARKMFLSGYQCSEAILAVIGQAWTEDFDPKLLKLATPFGGGIAERADLCGCVSGAAMALGLLYGRASLDDSLEPCWSLTQRFYDRFHNELGGTSCDYFTQGKFTKINHLRCYRLVAKSVKILWELIDEEQCKGRAGECVEYSEIKPSSF